MAEQPTNPKKIKDLKARLGRTVAPGTGGLPGAGGMPGGAPSSRPSSPGGLGAPKPSVPTPLSPIGPGSVAPPPFVGNAAAARAADPFAPTAAPQMRGPQDVRIVVDESAMEAAAVGRRSFAKVALLIGTGLALGIILGYFLWNTAAERKQYNLALQDGKDIFTSVQKAQEIVDQARTVAAKALEAAKGRGGAPSVDYNSIQGLQALKKPFDAGQFARRRYLALDTATVDALFAYYNNVNIMWDKINRLAARTLPVKRREQLDKSATAAAAIATPTGCVTTVVDGKVVCGLVFMEPKEGSEDSAIVRSQLRSSQTVEKKFLKSTDSLGDKPDDFVILIDTQRSSGVLGQGTNEFAQYVADLADLKNLADQTAEIQGQLNAGLAKVQATPSL